MPLPRPASVAAPLGFGLAVAGGVVVFGLAAAVRAASHRRIIRLGALPQAPVALVLGAEVYADGTPSRFLRARLDVALELYRRGIVERLLVSGDGDSPLYDETTGMRDYLVAHGVPADRIDVDPAGFDTYDSCVRAKEVFGLTRLIVVSQAYHLPRAITICRAIGLDAWGAGDETARTSSRTWRHGAGRELAANLKLAWDLGTRRPPADRRS